MDYNNASTRINPKLIVHYDRFGRKGVAINFVTDDDKRALQVLSISGVFL